MNSVWFKKHLMTAVAISGIALGLYSPAVLSLVTFAGSSGVDTQMNFSGNCAGCHSGTGSCGGTASQTSWLTNTSVSTRRTDVSSCYSNISTKISTTPSYGSRMPQGGPFYGLTLRTLFSTWNSNGKLLNASPTVTTVSATLVTRSSAALRSNIAQNGSSTNVNFSYSLLSNLAGSITTVSSSPSGSGGGTGTQASNRSISGLLCNRTYYYRAQGSNGVGSTNGSILNFTTSACSTPIITEGGTTASTTELFVVGKSGSLTNVDFVLAATDLDPNGTLTWSKVSGPVLGTATVSGGGSSPTINYNAPASTAGSPDSFVVRVTDEAGLTDTVTFSITITDTPPTITNVSQPESLIVIEDSSNTVTLTATDPDPDILTWTVLISPARGVVTGNPNLGTGASKIVTYTPNINVDTSDSFVIRVSDGAGTDQITVNVSITAQPDSPVANNDASFEVLVNSAANTLNVLANDTDVDTGDTLTLAAQAITGSNGGTITINNAGVVNNDINYTPVAGATVAETFTYTVTDSDGLTDTALVTVSPPDTDGDGVVDYIDNCPATSNAGQADNDGDQIINANNSTDPVQNVGVSTPGGDACDLDDDNDGMPDTFENTFGFDKNDPADAALDQDGDGVNNLQEFLMGTDPTVDSVGPTITVPAAVMVDSTGYLTMVDIGVATANDGNEGSISTVIPVVDGSITCGQLGSTPDTISALRPGSYTVTWHSCDSESNLSTVDQSVTVLPLISTTAGQPTSEGLTARFEVMLNGPFNVDVDVDYTIGGVALPGVDFTDNVADSVTGTITIASGATTGFVDFEILTDAEIEFVEDIAIALSNPVNAALGAVTQHRILITTFDEPPVVDITVDQDITIAPGVEGVGSMIIIGSAPVVITANAFDANGDRLSYDWSATDNALMPPIVVGAVNSFNIDTSSLTPGLYFVSVSVAGGTQTTIRNMLLVAQGPVATVLPVTDTDGDGLNDNDPLEGFGDEDGDGIPNYLDNLFLAPNVINNQTGDLGNSFIIQTDPGLDIRKGTTAVAAGVAGVLISQAQLEANGGDAGGVVTNAVDSNANTSGLYDFEISGLNSSISSANIVIPLPSALQKNSVYRKYTTTNGWFSFVQNNNNRVSSAPGDLGVCPSPGSALYTPGLTPFHFCMQLTIEDGGPNDADGTRNFVIRDPGGVMVQPTAAKKSSDSDGRIGVVHPLLLLIMLLPFVYAYQVQIRREYVRIVRKKKQ